MNDDDDISILKASDIDKTMEHIKNYETPPDQCLKCGKTYYGGYGYHIGECDECWFSRFPKEQVERFYRSFFD